MSDINFDSLTVSDTGQVTFSGLGSGIDFEAAVDGIISARRIPVDRLEANVESNALKIAAFQDLRTLLNTLQDGMSALRGAPSFDGSASVFNTKQAFASVSRTDGATPSSAANLIGITVTNAATAEGHDIEVLQAARAHKIASDSVTDTTAALGLTEADQFTIEGTVITVSSADTLLTLRDRINAANTGTSATGVSASIVSVSTTQHYLVLNKDTAGADITISDTTGTPLQTVGILTGGVPKNELQASQTAQLYADGILDSTNTTYESARQTSSAVTLDSTGQITLDDSTLPAAVINYNTGDSIADLAAAINLNANAITMGVSASVVTEGSEVRLKITTTGDGFTIAETGAGTVLTDLGIGNSRQLIERNTNTVSDLFAGVTLSLFQAEVGTLIHVDIEQDLSAIKTQITAFVDAYNAAKVFINGQTAIDETTGVVAEDAILFGSRALGDIESQLNQIIGIGTQGVDAAFSVLAQIGIDFVDNASLTDPLEADTLVIDDSILDSVLLSNPDDVQRLFAFDFSTSNPNITLLSFSGNTDYAAAGYVLNVNYDDRYQSDAVTDAGSFTQVDAQTGGPASDGISAITFADTVISGQAFRYSYDGSATESLTVRNLTLGTSETIDITANLDAFVGTGLDLGAGETIDFNFSTLGVTLTLSGDNGFTRATAIADGTLDVSALDANTTLTGGAITTPTSSMDKLTVDALVAAGAYNATTGLLTLGVTSTAAGEAHFDLAAGIKFRVDGGSVLTDITAVDLDDAGAHTVDIYVNDGTSDVIVATLDFTTIASTLAGNGSLTIDLGTGLLGETSNVASATAPMENYLTTPALGNGTFNIRDSTNTIIGTFAYNATDSLTDLATLIDADANLNASIVSSGGTFRLDVTHATNDALTVANDTLTFTDDTDSLIAQLNMTDNGTSIFSANIGGAANGTDDGTVTVNGNTMTVTSLSGAEGLQLLYTGNAEASAIQLDFTVGVGSQMYFKLEDILNETTGTVENEIESLSDQNTFNETRIADILARLERQRISLLQRFIAMESALATLNSISDQIKQTFDVLNNS